MTRYYLDTEFVAHESSVLPISVGIVREDGQEYYAEIFSGWRAHADSWVLKHVEPHLNGTGRVLPGEFAADLKRWVGDKPAEFMAYYAAYDWVVLCQLMGGMMALPNNWKQWVDDFQWRAPTKQEKAILDFRIKNSKEHHALHDAWELKNRDELLTRLRAPVWKAGGKSWE